MRISLKWLRELVDFELTPEELGEALTLAGFEVEDIEDRRTWADGVVLGKILKTEPHPNADKLQVCQVDLGVKPPSTIVCGAANARAGILVAVAPPGTHLPALNLTIEKAEKRGVTSAGMICSLAELGLEKTSEGIHEFPTDLDLKTHPLGSDVRPLLGLDDVVLDLTSTANRADALSMVGIAREVAALTRNPLHLPSITDLKAKPIAGLNLQIADAKACPAYSGVLIEGVKIGPSPNWLKHRLAAAGTRSINNVVDITNLILLEWGQPLHAFDWDRLLGVMGKPKKLALGVRLAQAGETLKTLDGQTRTLQAESHLITAADKPVALAGVMGGEETEVNPETSSIFLEAALFDPVVTRRSARSQSLRTEASARYERGVNFASLDQARDRAVQLILELAGGKVVGLTTFDQRPSLERTLELRLARLIDVLGDDVRTADVEEILPALGFQLSPCIPKAVTKPGAKPAAPETETAAVARCVWQVQVPPYRLRDIEREIDLIEEFARLYGYDRFSETLPPEPQVGSLSPRESFTRQIREVLRAIGLTELYHLSLCPAEAEEKGSKNTLVKIANPLSPEYSAVRNALLPGLVEAFRFNWDQGNGPLQAFEIGRVFAHALPPSPHPYQEADHIGGILGGDPNPNDWQHHNRPMDWFEAKGLLVSALERLGFHPEFRLDSPSEQFPELHPGRQASLWIEGSRMGLLGQLHPRLCQEKGLPDQVYVFELELDPLLEILEKRGIVQFSPFSPFPASDRDIAFFAPVRLSVGELEQAIRQAGGELLQLVQLFDEYRGQGVPEGQRSLAFRLVYRAPDRTLTDAEVEAAQSRVRTQLQKQFQVSLRS
ncbi:phenylalanine--tRNA ligase subunit beta [Synechococcus sp. Nb3U1]|uniref:phenylalanine--tRNA ligase subunit beta n=1 Tax=Synechococcus sp. Nb3U1 TaxID=1914529 RepID=UPI001F282F18|nr:phenylalanine--tRNA ligase subunit beta [Synechococcus sp. Nb3U1]MCF2970619.1 phenylalanine--tRNA ligase subunit beta [Synechococcus sp. Nb3U1]